MLSRDAVAALAATVLAAVAAPAVLLAGFWGLFALGGMVVIGGAWLAFRPRGGGQASAPIGVVAAVILCGIAPGTFVALTPEPPSRSWVVPLLISVVVGIRLAWLIGDGVQRLVESMVWIFVYIFFGLAPLVQLRRRIDPDTTPFLDHSLDAAALGIVVVGTLGLGAGLAAGRRTVQADGRPHTPPVVRPARVTLMAIVGLAGALYFITSVGLGAVVSPRAELGRVASATWSDSTIVAIVRALAVMPLLVAFVALQLERATGLSTSWVRRRLLPILTGGVLLLVANPVGNARYTSGTIYLAVFASLGLVATRPRFRILTAGFLASLVVIFPFADAFRYTTTAAFKAGDPVSAMTTGDFDAYAQVLNTVAYVEANGPTWGYQALGPLLFWIPRSIWPAKPLDTGILLAESRGYSFTNLSAPLWAEFFINGGWLALILGMFAFGMLVRRWDGNIIATLRQSRIPGLYACILPFYLLILLRGSVLQATAAFVVIVLAAWYVLDRAGPLGGDPAAVAGVSRSDQGSTVNSTGAGEVGSRGPGLSPVPPG